MRVPQFNAKLTGRFLRTHIAKFAFEECCGNRDKAVKMITGWLAADFKLNQRYLSDILPITIKESVDVHIRGMRPIFRQAQSQLSAARMAGIAEASKRNKMDWHIRPGLRLGDATTKDLIAAAEEREKSARTMNHDAALFRLIAKELKPEQKVESVMKSDDIERLQKKTHKEAA